MRLTGSRRRYFRNETVRARKDSFPYIYAFFTYSRQCRPLLRRAIASIPRGEYIVVNTRKYDSLAQAWNKAIKATVINGGYKAIIICNDDIEFPNDTGALLYFALTYTKEYGSIMTTAYDMDWYGDKGTLLRAADGDMPPGLHAFCIDEDLLDKVGWYDERFKGAYFEDTDMQTRIAQANLVTVVVAPVHHYGAATTKLNHRRAKEIEAIRNANWQRFKEKWPDVQLGRWINE